MQNLFIENKTKLFIKNYEALKEVKSFKYSGMLQYSCALAFTNKNTVVNKLLLEDSLEIIKNNTGVFSNFRGNCQFYIASLLCFESNREIAFKSILEIYEKLKKEKFTNDTYLPFVAAIIYQNKEKMDTDTIISKMKYVYDFMKSKHPFLTSSNDYSKAALIAINSKDLDKDLDYIEKCYEYFNKNGFSKSDNLQSLSHIMCFNSKEDVKVSCDKVLKLKDTFKSKDLKMYWYGDPLIGAISLLNIEEDKIANEVSQVSEYLKDKKGFGNFVLGKDNRNMISCNIVASSYEESLVLESNANNVANDIFLDIIIAIEVATMIAIISATTVATTSGS